MHGFEAFSPKKNVSRPLPCVTKIWQADGQKSQATTSALRLNQGANEKFCHQPVRPHRNKGTAMLRDSLEMFSACEHAAKWAGAPYMIENPVGKFSDHMGIPDYTFQPWQWEDNYTKLTCLWTGNGFIMPKPKVLKKPDDTESLIWKMPPSEYRSDLRSVTPMGFANAVFEANAPDEFPQCA